MRISIVRGATPWLLAAALTAGMSAAVAQQKPAPRAGAPKPNAPAARFKPAVLELAPGETYLVEAFFASPTGREHPGKLTYKPDEGLTVKPDGRYTGKVPRYGLKTYPKITAGRNVSGELAVAGTVEGAGTAVLKVKIVQPEMQPVPGDMKLTVKLTNPFSDRLFTGRVIASNPDRFLQNVTSREFKLGPGKHGEVVFPLPGAAAAAGETYDFTLKLETYQGFRTQKTYALEFPPLRPLEFRPDQK